MTMMNRADFEIDYTYFLIFSIHKIFRDLPKVRKRRQEHLGNAFYKAEYSLPDRLVFRFTWFFIRSITRNEDDDYNVPRFVSGSFFSSPNMAVRSCITANVVESEYSIAVLSN